MSSRSAGCLPSSRGVAFLAVLAMLSMGQDARAQQSFATGQSISPAYEGWVQNEDGSFDLVFGYMNRNWEQVVGVPVGPENTIEPGGPDQGQPTRFQPRRNRFVFSIRVPADFGDRELVWTLTANGQTHRAYATLKRDYFIDDLVIQANFGAAGRRRLDPRAGPERRAGAGRRGRLRPAPCQWASRWRSTASVTDDDGPAGAAPRPHQSPAAGPLHHRHRDRPAAVVVRLPGRRAGRRSTRRKS